MSHASQKHSGCAVNHDQTRDSARHIAGGKITAGRCGGRSQVSSVITGVARACCEYVVGARLTRFKHDFGWNNITRPPCYREPNLLTVPTPACALRELCKPIKERNIHWQSTLVASRVSVGNLWSRRTSAARGASSEPPTIKA